MRIYALSYSTVAGNGQEGFKFVNNDLQIILTRILNAV